MSESDTPQLDLLSVKVTNERVALNVLIGFIGLAQKRGTFAVNESAKLYEAIKIFLPPQQEASSETQTSESTQSPKASSPDVSPREESKSEEDADSKSREF